MFLQEHSPGGVQGRAWESSGEDQFPTSIRFSDNYRHFYSIIPDISPPFLPPVN